MLQSLAGSSRTTPHKKLRGRDAVARRIAARAWSNSVRCGDRALRRRRRALGRRDPAVAASRRLRTHLRGGFASVTLGFHVGARSDEGGLESLAHALMRFLETRHLVAAAFDAGAQRVVAHPHGRGLGVRAMPAGSTSSPPLGPFGTAAVAGERRTRTMPAAGAFTGSRAGRRGRRCATVE